MKYDIYHLIFDAPAHFGIEGIGQERIESTVRSDTLWAAVIQKWLLLFDDDPEMLCKKPPFSVSSCFPIISGSRFYPLPVGVLDAMINEAETGQMKDSAGFSVKDLKRVGYLSEELFRHLLGGGALTFDNLKEKQSHFPNMNQQAQQEETNGFAEQLQRPRVKTDQLTAGVGEDAFFYCTDQYFADQGGLFFLAAFATEAGKKCFEAALRLLGDSGLGADRSLGRGTFRLDPHEVTFPSSKKSTPQYLSLSLYHPTEAEAKKGILADREKSSYALVRRYGYAAAPGVLGARRADVWMLAEGSVLPWQPVGDIPCVIEKNRNIPHNVYRYGRAFCLPMSTKTRRAR